MSTNYWVQQGLMNDGSSSAFVLNTGKPAAIIKYWADTRLTQSNSITTTHNWAGKFFSKAVTNAAKFDDNHIIASPEEIGILKTKSGTTFADCNNVLSSKLTGETLLAYIGRRPYYLPQPKPSVPVQPQLHAHSQPRLHTHSQPQHNVTNVQNKRATKLSALQKIDVDFTSDADDTNTNTNTKSQSTSNDIDIIDALMEQEMKEALENSLKTQSVVLDPAQQKLLNFEKFGWCSTGQGDRRIFVIAAAGNLGVYRITRPVLYDLCNEFEDFKYSLSGIGSFGGKAMSKIVDYNATCGFFIAEPYKEKVQEILKKTSLFPAEFDIKISTVASRLMKGENGIDPRVANDPKARKARPKNPTTTKTLKQKKTKNKKNKKKKKQLISISDQKTFRGLQKHVGASIYDDIVWWLDEVQDLERRDSQRVCKQAIAEMKRGHQQFHEYNQCNDSYGYNDDESRSRSRSRDTRLGRWQPNRCDAYNDESRSRSRSRDIGRLESSRDNRVVNKVQDLESSQDNSISKDIANDSQQNTKPNSREMSLDEETK